MRKIVIAATALVLVAAVSCQKDNLDPKPAKQTVSIKATTEQQVSTKSSLTSDNNVVWSDGDAIAVCGTDNVSAFSTFTYDGTPGETEGYFTGEQVSGTMVAVYPADAVPEGASLVSADGQYSIPVTIPATQTYAEGGFANAANVAVAVGTETLSFKNVMSVLKIQVYGTSARNITRVQLAAAEPLCGEATLTVGADGENPALTFDDTKSSKILTLNVENVAFSTDEAAPTSFYFVVPANSLSSGFTVSIENGAANDSFYALAKTKTDNTTARSVITEMPVKAVSFTSSKSKLANTLICNPGETADIFPLQPVTGNLLGHGTGISAIANSFASGETKGEFANYTNGMARYTSVDKGTHICALKDFEGTILWSWTVWITETPGDLTLTDGSVIMDRNLGAKAGERVEGNTYQDIRGLFYQWGRKDPLFNPSSNAVACTAETGTLEYVIANPLKFIYGSMDQPSPNDWLWNKNNSLWGTTKTEYDPCPAGYKVPDGNDNSFWLANDMAKNHGSYDETYCGYDFNILDDDTSFLLVGSYCTVKDGKATTYKGTGYYWCCNSVGVTITVDNEKVSGYYGRTYKLSSSGFSKSNLARYYGGSIRCQKIL